MNRVRLVLFLILLVIKPQVSLANDMASLQQQGRVSVEAFVSKEKTVSLHQQVTLTIEVATDTWFTKGTKIHHFDVYNALIANRSAFAVNSAQRRHGKTYAVQQWEMTLYPLATGEIIVPSITVQMQVKGDNANIEGYLVTHPVTIKVNKPSAQMNPDNLWLVSPSVNLTQHWSQVSSNSDEMNVGDALQRSVSLDVQDNTIMLIPELLAKSVSDQGYQRYVETTEKRDSANRGDHFASLKQQVTYVFEQPGQFVIPGIEIYQWNPETQTMERHTLSDKTVSIKHTFGSYLRTYWLRLSFGFGALCFVTLMLYRLGQRYQKAKQEQKLPLVWLFLAALWELDQISLENLLLRKLLRRHCYQLSEGSCHPRYQEWVRRITTQRYSHNATGVNTSSRLAWLKIWILAGGEKGYGG
ncbi:BatD family protein [Vibrio hangzhouensis]|uniref:Oxygen tolerance n=1 Tax=Vibrio hangzhouensis TaxID=462991 RepID=A0A1H5X5C7_9VIBR|nr:BatD family protein [Vibrio hangzhouensis]SEG06974.1 Oxygen tolerance [Vibrio hangzhouensis]